MPICSAQRPSSCLSVCYCACPQPDCFGAYPSSARQHPQTTSLCWHPESSSRPRFVRTNGIKLSQNAAAIFSRVESASRKLPTRLNGSTAERGRADAPSPCPPAQLPDPLAVGQPRLRANLGRRWIGSEREQEKPTSHLHGKDCGALLQEGACCSSDSAFHRVKSVPRDPGKHSALHRANIVQHHFF